jgi:hypothetical protein
MKPCTILDYFLDRECQDALITELPATNLLWYSHSFQFANLSCYFAFVYLWYQVGVTDVYSRN